MNALQVVADVITRWPGLRSREIVERSGYCAGTVQRAISAMRHDGLVRMTGLRYYPVSGAVTVSQAAATYMHYPPQSRTDVQILAALATGPQTQAELRAIVGGPAFAVRDRLRGLVRRGLVVCDDGTYRIVQHLVGRRLHVAERVTQRLHVSEPRTAGQIAGIAPPMSLDDVRVALRLLSEIGAVVRVDGHPARWLARGNRRRAPG